MMATLRIKSDELVLEHFFNEYITVWFQARTVDARTWEAARKEINLLKGLKRDRKQKHELLRATGKGIHDVETLPTSKDARKQSEVAKGRPSDSPKWYLKGLEPNDRDRNSEGKLEAKQTYTKEEVDLQRVLEENFILKKKVAEMKEKIGNLRAEAYIEVSEKEQQLEKLKKALENSKAQVDDLTLRLVKASPSAQSE